MGVRKNKRKGDEQKDHHRHRAYAQCGTFLLSVVYKCCSSGAKQGARWPSYVLCSMRGVFFFFCSCLISFLCMVLLLFFVSAVFAISIMLPDYSGQERKAQDTEEKDKAF